MVLFVVRIITVSMETADPNILVGSVLSMILNYVIIGVAIMYTPKEKKLKSDEDLSNGTTTNGATKKVE